MIFPPSLVRIRVQREGKRRRRLWLPVFLLWPLVPIVTFFLVVFLVAKALLGGGLRSSFRIFRIWVLGLVLLCRLRRLRVGVKDAKSDLLIAVW